jgi:NodT family efflux transporter outer membrane factor (OMF) lipoprotein
MEVSDVRRNDKSRQALSRGFPALAAAVAMLGVLLALGACSVGPKFEKPETAVKADASWKETSDPRIKSAAPADSLWWKSFNDTALDKLVDLAYQQNLPLQTAGLRIAEARARLAATSGKKWPQVQMAFGKVAAVGLPGNAANVSGFDLNFVDYQVGFDAIWEMDLWGKYSRNVEADAASMFASVADYDYALVSLTAEVARTYALVRTYEVLIDQAKENVKVQEEGLRIADARFRAGATSELDVTQATSLLESTRASIPRLQVNLQQTQNALSTLLGQPTGTIDELLAGPREIPKGPAEIAVSVPAEMLRRRPDIRSAELQAAAQCARVGVSKADLYPTLSLRGMIGLNTTSGTPNLSGGGLFYSLGAGLVYPLLNYGRIKHNVRVPDARYQQQLVGYRDAVLKAAQEVEDALSGFLNAQEATVFSEGSVKAAQRSVEISLVQYKEGAVDYQRVLDAQRSLLQEQNSLAQTRSSIATNLIALYKALGGGWEVRQGQAIIPQSVQDEMKDRTNWGDLLSPPPAKKTSNPPPGEKK